MTKQKQIGEIILLIDLKQILIKKVQLIINLFKLL